MTPVAKHAMYPDARSLASADIRAAADKKRVIDAKVTLLQQEIRNLNTEKQEIEDSLWMQIERSDLKEILESGRYGKSLDVKPSLGLPDYTTNATIMDGMLLIGGYVGNDHFRKGVFFVRRDFGQTQSY
jgi:hypothetical protein